ncbi:MAG: hypothetical protein ACT4P4_03430 [Betaproteobacteria bacterium]
MVAITDEKARSLLWQKNAWSLIRQTRARRRSLDAGDQRRLDALTERLARQAPDLRSAQLVINLRSRLNAPIVGGAAASLYERELDEAIEALAQALDDSRV